MKRTLLLTGGSGVIGRALLDAMAADFDIVCLRGRRPIDDPRVSEFAGDFTHPTLGLSAADYSRLADRVDVVLHGAAVTKWNVDPERLRAVNVQGPASMLRLAADADAPLYYLSTAFVIRQAPSDERFAGLAAYLESKTEAEELVRAGSVPAVILRPSVVTGDSRDGSMAAFQGLHRMLGNAIRGNLPVVPGEIGSLVDTVPLDIVVDAVGKLIRERVTGDEYWLTAGDQALTFTDIAEVCEDVSRLAEVGATRPRFMPFESVDRLLMPLLDELIPDGRRQMLTDFLESVWVFQSSEAMPSDLDRLGFGDRATREALTEALRRSLIYWAQVKKLLPAERQLVESVV
ncbi:SDR family oxidoreductase [Prescottella agglutinans]|uniref:Thioester reductase-like protein n=1 Tax=Prescottella agglutinans TaxID=1644129 RepID=A0ABT6M9N0_9NOCA|nr:SDR family oxidoreductase [Prescottella agglutinans]MDH6281023.1 thioester reductase-like protein [Prescottella agglutinans]